MQFQNQIQNQFLNQIPLNPIGAAPPGFMPNMMNPQMFQQQNPQAKQFQPPIGQPMLGQAPNMLGQQMPPQFQQMPFCGQQGFMPQMQQMNPMNQQFMFPNMMAPNMMQQQQIQNKPNDLSKKKVNSQKSDNEQVNTSSKQSSKKPVDKLETLLSSLDMNIVQSNDPKLRYQYIFEEKNLKDEDIVCDVCLNDIVDEDDDNLLICDLCNAAVHQLCYGNELYDSFPAENEQWFCQRCRYLRNNPNLVVTNAVCVFCNDLKGIMLNNPSLGWAHITCINWMPDVWFKDDKKTQLEGQFNQERAKLFCYICRKKNSGSCIQCDYRNCQQAFHVRCAIKEGIIKDSDLMTDQRHGEDLEECFVFCDKHIEIGIRDLKQGGKERIRMTSEKAQILSKLSRLGGSIKSKRGKKKGVGKKPNENPEEKTPLLEKADGDAAFAEPQEKELDEAEADENYSDKEPKAKKNKKKKSKIGKQPMRKSTRKAPQQLQTTPQQQIPIQNPMQSFFSNATADQANNQLQLMMMQMMAMQNQQQANNQQQFFPGIMPANNFAANMQPVQQQTQAPNQVNNPFPTSNIQFGASLDASTTSKSSKKAHKSKKTGKPASTNTLQRPLNIGSFPSQQSDSKNNKDNVLFLAEDKFCELIKIPENPANRKVIQNAFISWAIENQIVCEKLKEYQIIKDPYLFQRIQRESVKPNEIFKYLKLFLKEVPQNQEQSNYK